LTALTFLFLLPLGQQVRQADLLPKDGCGGKRSKKVKGSEHGRFPPPPFSFFLRLLDFRQRYGGTDITPSWTDSFLLFSLFGDYSEDISLVQGIYKGRGPFPTAVFPSFSFSSWGVSSRPLTDEVVEASRLPSPPFSPFFFPFRGGQL